MPETRQAIIDFFISLAGSEDVALHTIYYSQKYEIPLLISFSLAYVESRFLPNAVNENSNLSVDRGVFQLNSNSFPHLEINDFWNPEISARYGLSYLDWCFEKTTSTELALAMYNAGYSRVNRGIIPASTSIYIQKILRVQEQMRQELYEYLQEVVPDLIVRLASL
jgi:soluble lytic murein transglycosylase-like protein